MNILFQGIFPRTHGKSPNFSTRDPRPCGFSLRWLAASDPSCGFWGLDYVSSDLRVGLLELILWHPGVRRRKNLIIGAAFTSTRHLRFLAPQTSCESLCYVCMYVCHSEPLSQRLRKSLGMQNNKYVCMRVCVYVCVYIYIYIYYD